jgi:hypothetical protein
MHSGYTVIDIMETKENHTFSALNGFDYTTQQSTGKTSSRLLHREKKEEDEDRVRGRRRYIAERKWR